MNFVDIKMNKLKGEFNRIYELAIKKASYLEPWDGHYLTRKVETEILAKKFDFHQDYIGLDLGCGNAFQSALLASLSKRIFATDLPGENRHTHTLGIKKAQDLISKLNIKNITLIGCTAAVLPFASDSFDFVFLSSVLEHIHKREAVLNEIKRVLKPNSYLILIVPTHMASIYAFPHVFLYILARGLKPVIGLFKNIDKDARKNKADYLNKSSIDSFKKNHPSFPFPEPHGEFVNIIQELSRQFPHKWAELIKKPGFKITRNFSTCLLPWLLFEPFSTRIAAQLYSRSKKMHLSVLGNLSFLGYLNCFIAINVK